MDNHWKNKTPQETAAIIEKILEKDFGLTLNSHYYETNPLGVYSTHVTAVDLPNSYSTNGKGITPAYALASGEAEFIERLQTFMLFNRPYNTPLFQDDFVNEDGVVVCPYLNLNTKEFHNFQTFFGHSTGMASGNTLKEAVVHAICEVVERQSNLELAQGILQVNAKIPMAACQFDYKEIERVFNGKVQLFDIGRFGIPTVAMICRNEETRQLIFHIDTAPTLELAIERCFTEFFQNNSFPNMQCLHWQGELEDIECPNYHVKYGMLVDYHIGVLPKSIVELIENASVQTKIVDYSYLKNEDALIQHFLQQSKVIFPSGVFLRDFSWAGFPTVFLYIPDLINEEYTSEELYLHIHKYCLDEYRRYIGPNSQIPKDLIVRLLNMYFGRKDPVLREHQNQHENKNALTRLYSVNLEKLTNKILSKASEFQMNMEDFYDCCLLKI